jgi:hypothetical protein
MKTFSIILILFILMVGLVKVEGECIKADNEQGKKGYFSNTLKIWYKSKPYCATAEAKARSEEVKARAKERRTEHDKKMEERKLKREQRKKNKDL